MKTVFSMALAITLLGSSAFGQELKGSRSKALAWVKSQLAGQTFKDVHGRTSDGRLCGLFLTDKSNEGVEDYYVVVGYANTKDKNDYIGMPTSQSTALKSDAILNFATDQSWGNDSTFNRVTINTDSQEKPLVAKGVSDLKSIECQLN